MALLLLKPRGNTASVKAAMQSLLYRRPVSCFSVLSLAGLAGYSSITEIRAEEQERRHLLQQDNNDLTEALVLPRVYDWDAVNNYWMKRPITASMRLVKVFAEMAPFVGACVFDFVLQTPEPSQAAELQVQHAVRLREALTNLGPAFVKAGQQLSIRPDLVPPVVLQELQKLCDAVRPIPDDIAFQVIRDELQEDDLDRIFQDMKLVASASLGQVYKAKLRKGGDTVAVKVQRPDMLRMFSLDLFLLQRIGVLVDAFTSTFTNQPPFHKALYESFSKGSYLELDYENEANNQILFKKEFAARNCPVVVPKVYKELSSERVLTSEWIDGIKLSDSPKDQIRSLIPVGVELFLTQLLDIGTFHADPHVGNLLVTESGQLCLLDFGLCAEVDDKARHAMTRAIVHLLMRDFDSLVSEDAKELGFLPEEFDTSEIKPVIIKILTGTIESGSDLRNRKRKLLEISNELNEVFFRYPFSVPPFFALVTRGLGLLEGIALAGDPSFDIFRASAPYARSHAVRLLGRHTFNRRRPRIEGK